MNSRDPPSKILLLIITQLSPTFPLTNDLLHDIFKDFGEVKKILIFERGKSNKAFVEYFRVKDAVLARREMASRQLAPSGGKLQIHFSRLKGLDLEVVDNSRGTDYTRDSVNDEVPHSKTDDPKVLRTQIAEVGRRSVTQGSSQESLGSRNDEINNLLNSDEDIWVPPIEVSKEVKEILAQKQSPILRVMQVDSRVTAKMLVNVFTRFGNIEVLLYERKQQRAFIQFVTVEYATIAKEYLNNINFFDSQLRIYFQPIQQLQPTSLQDEYFVYNRQPLKTIVPLSRAIVVSGVQDVIEISEMMRLVGKVNEIKILQNSCLEVSMTNIFEALKIVAVFSDYEFKNQKLSIVFK